LQGFFWLLGELTEINPMGWRQFHPAPHIAGARDALKSQQP